MKPSLKWIAKAHLKRDIQNSERGHDSVEDALASLDLIKLKIAKGSLFGRFNMDVESIFKKLVCYAKKSAIVDDLSGFKQDVDLYVPFNNDEEQHIANICKAVESDADFIWTRLKTIEPFYRSEATAEAVLASLNSQLEKMHASLPNNSMLVLCSGQGDSTDFTR